MERVTGIEPATFCMASRRSSQLSYTRSRCGSLVAEPFSDANRDHAQEAPCPVSRILRKTSTW